MEGTEKIEPELLFEVSTIISVLGPLKRLIVSHIFSNLKAVKKVRVQNIFQIAEILVTRFRLLISTCMDVFRP